MTQDRFGTDPHGFFKHLGDRHGTCSHAAAHNRHPDVGDGLSAAKTKEIPKQGHQSQGTDNGSDDTGEIADRRSYEQLTVHSQDRACDQRSDIKIKKAGALHKSGTVLRNGIRNDMPVNQSRTAEDTYDGSTAQIGLDKRGHVTDQIQQLTEYHKKQKSPHHARRKRTQYASDNDHSGNNEKPLQIQSGDFDFFHIRSSSAPLVVSSLTLLFYY